MRDGRRRSVLAALAALSLAGAPAAAQVPLSVGRRHAVVIGVNGTSSPFSGVPTLQFAGKDADSMTDLLRDAGWDVVRLGPRDATRANIVRELSRLSYDAGESDTVLVYFAGHGVRDPGPSGETYWLTYHASPAELPVEGLRLSHLAEYLAEIPAARKLLILDHCYSGDVEGLAGVIGSGARDGEASVGVVRKAFPIEDLRREAQRIGGGVVIFGSARQEAYEFADLEHGVFTHVLLRALGDSATDVNGNGRVSIGELAQSLTPILEELAAAREISQEPIEVVQGSGLFGWEPFEILLGTADDLRAFVSDLEASAGLEAAVANRSRQAIQTWDLARRQGVEASEADREIVFEINRLRELGDNMAREDKRVSLERVVRGGP